MSEFCICKGYSEQLTAMCLHRSVHGRNKEDMLAAATAAGKGAGRCGMVLTPAHGLCMRTSG